MAANSKPTRDRDPAMQQLMNVSNDFDDVVVNHAHMTQHVPSMCTNVLQCQTVTSVIYRFAASVTHTHTHTHTVAVYYVAY